MAKEKEGFTLIELLVVLAIIATVIALAIIGFNVANRTQRDTQRKQFINEVMPFLLQFQAVNNRLPTTGALIANGAARPFLTTPTAAQCPGSSDDGTYIYGSVWVYDNGACLGLNTMRLEKSATDFCNAPPSYPTDNTIVVCYHQQPGLGGNLGFILGTYLEEGTTYSVVQ